MKEILLAEFGHDIALKVNIFGGLVLSSLYLVDFNSLNDNMTGALIFGGVWICVMSIVLAIQSLKSTRNQLGLTIKLPVVPGIIALTHFAKVELNALILALGPSLFLTSVLRLGEPAIRTYMHMALNISHVLFFVMLALEYPTVLRIHKRIIVALLVAVLIFPMFVSLFTENTGFGRFLFSVHTQTNENILIQFGITVLILGYVFYLFRRRLSYVSKQR